MNRRSFLAWLGGTAAGAALAPTLDLERLLWVPGTKTILVPSPEAPMPWEESFREHYVVPAMMAIASEWDRQLVATLTVPVRFLIDEGSVGRLGVITGVRA